ncbi:MAG: GNAT family N-acetyltransferase [Pseudomonadota bacterium]
MSYTIETISDRAGFDALESEWNTLLSRSDTASLFLTHEWISAWLDIVPSAPPMLILTARDAQQRLCGIAPFYVGEMRLAGLRTYRCLRVLGDCHSGAENQDLIIDGTVTGVASALSDAIVDCAVHFDWMWIPHTRTGAGCSERMSVVAERMHGFCYTRSFEYCEIALPDCHDTYLKRLSKGTRYNLRRQSRQFADAALVERLQPNHADDLDGWLEDFFAMHARRWHAVGKQGSFERRPLLAQFYRRFIPVALARGWLRFYRMQIDGSTAAMQLGYRYGDRMMAIQEAFDPDGVAGAGNSLRERVISDCIAEGALIYDFLAHATPHKMRWRAATSEGLSLFCGVPSLANAPLKSLSLWPNGRFIQHSSP